MKVLVGFIGICCGLITGAVCLFVYENWDMIVTPKVTRVYQRPLYYVPPANPDYSPEDGITDEAPAPPEPELEELEPIPAPPAPFAEPDPDKPNMVSNPIDTMQFHIPLKNREVFDKPNEEGWWWYYTEGIDKSQMWASGTGLVRIARMGNPNEGLKLEALDYDYSNFGSPGYSSRMTWMPLKKWVAQEKANGGPNELKCVRLLEINPFEKERK